LADLLNLLPLKRGGRVAGDHDCSVPCGGVTHLDEALGPPVDSIPHLLAKAYPHPGRLAAGGHLPVQPGCPVAGHLSFGMTSKT